MSKILDTVQGIIAFTCFIAVAGMAKVCEDGGSIMSFIIGALIAFAILFIDIKVYSIRERRAINERRKNSRAGK